MEEEMNKEDSECNDVTRVLKDVTATTTITTTF
jgi:hypothetical protein